VNRKRAKELLPIFEAFSVGKAIEKRLSNTDNRWESTEDVTGLGEYRIKLKPREFWLNMDDINGSRPEVLPNLGDGFPAAGYIKVREVLE